MTSEQESLCRGSFDGRVAGRRPRGIPEPLHRHITNARPLATRRNSRHSNEFDADASFLRIAALIDTMGNLWMSLTGPRFLGTRETSEITDIRGFEKHLRRPTLGAARGDGAFEVQVSENPALPT